MSVSSSQSPHATRQPGPPGPPLEPPAAQVPSRHGDTFKHWQGKRAFASDEELLKCMEQAQECIEQMNVALSCRDEAFTLVHLEPTTRKTDAG